MLDSESTARPRASADPFPASSGIRRTVRLVAVGLMAGAVLLAPAAAHAEPSEDEIQSELNDRNEDLDAVIEEHNEKREELKKADKLIEKIEEELPEAEKEVADAQAKIADIIADAYISGDTAFVNAVLSGNGSDLADRVGYLSSLTSAQQDRLDEYLGKAAELQSKKEELEKLKKDSDKILKELEEKKEEIESEVGDLQYQLDEMNKPDPVTSNYNGDNSGVVQFGLDQQGEPYEWGSSGPDTWDCSGLVLGSWATAGVSLPHSVQMQWDYVAHVSRDQLQPGDIVFYEGLGHNALYIGDGQVVHAPQTGDVVRVASMDMMGIAGYGRP
ncbi:C40 family peptidase [Salininema proteolyticum]|uniref:NlpC/P60 family protein n=1 Tax=Salininema proteolyticum TaxID=1607685 RepID=A0ABV8U2I3_9ACTN